MASMVIGADVWAPGEAETAREVVGHCGTVAPEGAPNGVKLQLKVSGLPWAVANPDIEAAVTETG